MALTKVVQSSLFATQVVTGGTPGQVIASSPFACPTNFASAFYIDFSPVALTGSPAATEWRIECSQLDDNTIWTPIYSRLSPTDIPVNPNVTTATAGTPTVIVSNIASFAAGQIVFFKNGTILNSEWGEIIAVNNGTSTLTLLDNLLFNQVGTNNIFNGGLRASIELPLTARVRYRAVINNNRGTNRDVAFRINHTTLNAVT